MEMSFDELNAECRYCCREVDTSGLEAFRCTNEFINKSTGWCRPQNANEPCSTCEFCETKDDKECLFYETCSLRTAVCKVRQPDMGCPVYRYFKGLIVKDHEARSKADMVAILDKIRAEIIKYEVDCRLSVDEHPSCKQCTDNVFKTIYGILDKHNAESEAEDGNDE